MKQLHECMSKSGLTESVGLFEKCFDLQTGRPKGKTPSRGKPIAGDNHNFNSNNIRLLDATQSVEMIYKNAVEKCNSSSSEDNIMEISGEGFDVTFNQLNLTPAVPVEPSTSKRDETQFNRREPNRRHRDNPDESIEDKAARSVRDAEAAKVKVFNSTGENHKSIEAVVWMDQDYLLVGNHVDKSTQIKIIRGEYIDFGKLLPKDKVLTEEEVRMELVIKNGRSFWTPISESVVINNFAKWEQAFRIYSDIYTPGTST